MWTETQTSMTGIHRNKHRMTDRLSLILTVILDKEANDGNENSSQLLVQ